MTSTAPTRSRSRAGRAAHRCTRGSTRSCSLRAYQFSEAAHRGQTRNSGEPYVTHCVEVAKILADLQLDSVTVASGLIHDVVEDTAITRRRRRARVREGDRADRRRADEDRQAADCGSTQERQVESYRKLLLSIAKDARVIIDQARRPTAQHADARLAAAGEAPPHRAGNARPVRAARAPLRYGEDAVGARGPRVQASRAGRVQARSRSWSRRSAASARSSIARCASRSSARSRARASRTSTSRVGRSTSGRSTRR